MCCMAFLFQSRAQAVAASLMKQSQGITRADKRGSVTVDIRKCVTNKRKSKRAARSISTIWY